MPIRWSWYERMSRPGPGGLSKLLGELELEIMELMWRRQGASTVREIAGAIQGRRQVAYTTVMTVMSHLAEKGLLTRTPLDKKTHLYHVALGREEFLARESHKMVDSMLADFGDVALAQFLEVIEQVDPAHLQALRGLSAPPLPDPQREGGADDSGDAEEGGHARPGPGEGEPER
jgi:predicted transcriptional regulator